MSQKLSRFNESLHIFCTRIKCSRYPPQTFRKQSAAAHSALFLRRIRARNSVVEIHAYFFAHKMFVIVALFYLVLFFLFVLSMFTNARHKHIGVCYSIGACVYLSDICFGNFKLKSSANIELLPRYRSWMYHSCIVSEKKKCVQNALITRSLGWSVNFAYVLIAKWNLSFISYLKGLLKIFPSVLLQLEP